MRSYRNSGDGIVYLPVGIQNNRITPLAPPLILRENGLQTILKAELKKKQTIHINRKYPKYGHPMVTATAASYTHRTNTGWIQQFRIDDYPVTLPVITLQRPLRDRKSVV